MATKQRASLAQAKMIARVWSGDWQLHVMTKGRDNGEPWNDSTTLALLRRKWIEPNGAVPTLRNDLEYQGHVLTHAGIDALEDYLCEQRYGREPR